MAKNNNFILVEPVMDQPALNTFALNHKMWSRRAIIDSSPSIPPPPTCPTQRNILNLTHNTVWRNQPGPPTYSTYRAPPDRLCATGRAGSSSPPYPTGFSPAPWTETCSWFYCFLTASAAVVAPASLGRRTAPLLRPSYSAWPLRRKAGNDGS